MLMFKEPCANYFCLTNDSLVGNISGLIVAAYPKTLTSKAPINLQLSHRLLIPNANAHVHKHAFDDWLFSLSLSDVLAPKEVRREFKLTYRTFKIILRLTINLLWETDKSTEALAVLWSPSANISAASPVLNLSESWVNFLKICTEFHTEPEIRVMLMSASCKIISTKTIT